MTWFKVANAGDIEAGQAKVVEAGGKRIALCNTGDGIYAIDDMCSHDRGPLDQGKLIGHRIECPRHGAQFDVTNGKVLSLPAVRPIRSYPTRLDGKEIEVEV
ncbi:MAG: non-heme iron oxygenase ferredoxin subunit [Dehalococcoidia bacterium]|uniref:Rieske (2Fe-2S) protein n=1 Tax=Candidatus Amarobacter glycogenicus TaxID=3140699 RepID=UPI002A10F5E2|nr:non-heme iron oxygenase ferredoxin subunit [Dehalococcoidia bacterium]MBK8561450.1 non-heme iron oxygenase ferredoxin subunit [Dehalococcoidia bacterium]MBK9343124.1 non-heme iron oxygenase ferredoxin subunit [Dehalococcoidia bacterium]MBK9612256.1 non-heme iron oxygenase ferredoxin subunit [Dehalococcoidia bacterium]